MANISKIIYNDTEYWLQWWEATKRSTWYVTTSTLWQNSNYYYMYPWSRLFPKDCFCKQLSIWSFCFDEFEPIVSQDFYDNNKSDTAPAGVFIWDLSKCNEERTENFITVSRERFLAWKTVWEEVIANWLSAFITRREWAPTSWDFYANIWLVSPSWGCRCFYNSTANCWFPTSSLNTTSGRWWMFAQYCKWNWLVTCEWDRLFIEIWWTFNMWWNNYSSLYFWLQNHQTHTNEQIKQHLQWRTNYWCSACSHSVWYIDACWWCAKAYPVQISIRE